MKATAILSYALEKGDGVKTIGFDVAWDNDNFVFVSDENLGLFDIAAANITEGEENCITVAMGNASRLTSQDGDIMALTFEFNGAPSDVHFEIKNLSAKDGNGNPVSVTVNPVDLVIDTACVINWVWQ